MYKIGFLQHPVKPIQLCYPNNWWPRGNSLCRYPNRQAKLNYPTFNYGDCNCTRYLSKV